VTVRERIESLTPAQEDALRAWHATWLAHGTCTEPADRVTAERAVTALYARIGRAAPKFVWADSPLSAARTASSLGDSLRDSLRGSLRDSLWDSRCGARCGARWVGSTTPTGRRTTSMPETSSESHTTQRTPRPWTCGLTSLAPLGGGGPTKASASCQTGQPPYAWNRSRATADTASRHIESIARTAPLSPTGTDGRDCCTDR
jgi:hypothetical protein